MSGYTVIELIFVVMLTAILAAAAIPAATAGLERSRTLGAARYLASQLALARAQAAARSANVALFLAGGRGVFSIGVYWDGNANGVRIRDITAGLDPPIERPVRFADRFPRVLLFLNDPDSLSADTTALVSFSPIGTATSVTLYLRGPDNSQYAVRVLGATGRTRVLRFVPGTRQWIEIV